MPRYPRVTCTFSSDEEEVERAVGSTKCLKTKEGNRKQKQLTVEDNDDVVFLKCVPSGQNLSSDSDSDTSKDDEKEPEDKLVKEAPTNVLLKKKEVPKQLTRSHQGEEKRAVKIQPEFIRQNKKQAVEDDDDVVFLKRVPFEQNLSSDSDSDTSRDDEKDLEDKRKEKEVPKNIMLTKNKVSDKIPLSNIEIAQLKAPPIMAPEIIAPVTKPSETEAPNVKDAVIDICKENIPEIENLVRGSATIRPRLPCKLDESGNINIVQRKPIKTASEKVASILVAKNFQQEHPDPVITQNTPKTKMPKKTNRDLNAQIAKKTCTYHSSVREVYLTLPYRGIGADFMPDWVMEGQQRTRTMREQADLPEISNRQVGASKHGRENSSMNGVKEPPRKSCKTMTYKCSYLNCELMLSSPAAIIDHIAEHHLCEDREKTLETENNAEQFMIPVSEEFDLIEKVIV